MKKRIICIVSTVVLLLSLLVGCSLMDDRLPWERLEDTQYNSYKPNLDRLEQKYDEGYVAKWMEGERT